MALHHPRTAPATVQGPSLSSASASSLIVSRPSIAPIGSRASHFGLFAPGALQALPFWYYQIGEFGQAQRCIDEPSTYPKYQHISQYNQRNNSYKKLRCRASCRSGEFAVDLASGPIGRTSLGEKAGDALGRNPCAAFRRCM